jgi:hypothetical protein
MRGDLKPWLFASQQQAPKRRQGEDNMTKTNEPPHDAERLWDSREGYVAGTDGEGRPVVNFEGNAEGPRVALSTVPMAGAALAAAVTSRQRVQLRFQDGDARRPIIIGLSQEARQGAAPHPHRPVMAPFWRFSSMRTASRCELASPASG